MKKNVGLHLRVYSSLQEAVYKAERMKLDIFQMFFMTQERRMVDLSEQDIADFKVLVAGKFSSMIAHATYWTHIMHPDKLGFARFLDEMQLAYMLGFTDIVIHPGAFYKTIQHRQSAYKDIVNAVNYALDQIPDINIMFENVAHKGRAFSGDIIEYAAIFEHITQRERIKLCIDTAHLFVYGYDIRQEQVQEDFFATLTTHFDKETIALLHVNDAKHSCSSGVDQHLVPGSGKIGLEPLLRFIYHPAVAHVPMILEMPELDEEKELEIIRMMTRKHS